MALARRLAHEQSIGVLFTEHSMDVVFAQADRIIVLARGELIAEGRRRRCATTRACARSTSAAGRRSRPPRPSSGAKRRIPARRARPRCFAPLSMTAAGDAMLEVAHLDAWYGQAQILYGVSLGVGAGECVALLGRNGAGKSTTMKAIMGLMARRRGRVALPRPRHLGLAAVPHRPARARLGARGPPHLHRPHGAREPRRRAPAARATGAPAWTRGQALRALSQPRRRCPTGRAAA